MNEQHQADAYDAATDLQADYPPIVPLASICAQRLARFLREQFEPRSEASWTVADKLWRAALMTRDVERVQS